MVSKKRPKSSRESAVVTEGAWKVVEVCTVNYNERLPSSHGAALFGFLVSLGLFADCHKQNRPWPS